MLLSRREEASWTCFEQTIVEGRGGFSDDDAKPRWWRSLWAEVFPRSGAKIFEEFLRMKCEEREDSGSNTQHQYKIDHRINTIKQEIRRRSLSLFRTP